MPPGLNMKIVPLILTEDLDDFLLRLRQAESFAQYVQIDLMDGIFVPGFYGNPFKPQVLKQIEASRRMSSDKAISVDGGISLDHLKIFSELKVDYVSVGSRIFLHGDPRDNYRQFIEALAKLEQGLLK